MLDNNTEWQPDDAAIAMVPRTMADLYKFFPLSLVGDSTLIIAAENEENMEEAVSDLEAFLGVSVIVQAGHSASDIQHLIDNCYGPESEQLPFDVLDLEMTPQMTENIRCIEHRMRPLMERILADPDNAPSFEELQELVQQELGDDLEFLDDEKEEDKEDEE